MELPVSNKPAPPARGSDPLATTPASPRWQFSLRELMVAMLVFSLYFGATFWMNPIIGVFGGVGLVAGYAIWRRRRMIFGELAIFAVIFILLHALFLSITAIPRTPSRRMQCGNNVKLIALALQNYHDTFGSFPPAHVLDSNGNPMHSWRVLILPFVYRKDIYDKYHFDEPWNGPYNRLLQSEVIPFYGCPSDKSGVATDTDYVVVVGPGTVFPADKCTSMSQIRDGDDKTLLVVEVHNSGIHWMEPRDLHVTQMAGTINPQAGQGIASAHPKGALVAYVDGHVKFLPDDLPPEQLRARLTIAGGETVVEE